MRPVAVETRPIPQDLLQRLGRFDATICPGGKDCRGDPWGVLCLSRRGPKLFPNRNIYSGLLVSNPVRCTTHGGCAHCYGDRCHKVVYRVGLRYCLVRQARAEGGVQTQHQLDALQAAQAQVAVQMSCAAHCAERPRVAQLREQVPADVEYLLVSFG